MKYANYYFEGSQLNNLGDNLQLLAVDYIYEKMGIASEDIVQISTHELPIYAGEYAILPVSLPLVDYVPGGLSKRFSDKIIPVFLGLTLLRDFLYPEEVAYLARYSPIGCRDERTLSTLRRHGIVSYLNGCITALLPDAGINRSKLKKVFFVDVPEALKSHIPKDLLTRAQWETHLKKGSSKNAKQMAAEQYEMYKQEAALVVTSLLHCSVPCLAAGIPVIVAKTECSYRFAWLEKLIPIYLEKDFSNIDWTPAPIYYEEHKSRLLQNAVNRIQAACQEYNEPYSISEFYENRVRSPYIVDTFESIKTKLDTLWSQYAPQEYAIWGLTQLAEQTVSYIEEKYPNVRLAAVYDKNRRINFKGLRSQSPDALWEHKDIFVIVAAVAAKEEAKELFWKMNKAPDTYAISEIVL